jgi:hypothetical protein
VLQVLLALVRRHQIGFAVIEPVAVVKGNMAAVGYDLLGQDEGRELMPTIGVLQLDLTT